MELPNSGMHFSRMRVVGLHSLAMFFLSWMTLFYLKNGVTLILASSLSIPVEFSFYKPTYLIPSTLWNPDMVKLLFISPQLVALVFAIACFVVVFNVNRYVGLLKIFFIWGFVHGWAQCFGGMLVGMLTNTGFGFAADWMYLFDTMKLVLSLMSLFMLFAGGFLISHSWQMSINIYYNEVMEDMFPRFLFFQVTLVALVGVLVLILLRMPAPAGLQYVVPMLVVMLLPVSLKGNGFSDLQFDGLDRSFRLQFWLVVFAALALVVTRLVFGFGLRFGSLADPL